MKTADFPEHNAESFDTLALTMVNPVSGPPNGGPLPFFTYLGQFIDHDITLGTNDAAEHVAPILTDTLRRAARRDVSDGLANGRTGMLDLDNLYGDGAGGVLADAMRDGPRMRLSDTFASPLVPLGSDLPVITPGRPREDDLPRIGDLIDRGVLTVAQVDAALGAGAWRDQTALIADGRNDENLVVAQLHLAFLRLHNALVDEIKKTAPALSDDALFNEARVQAKNIYNWIVVKEYLVEVCDPSIVQQVLDQRAPLYAKMQQGYGGDQPRMPVEFAAAAFRFGHSTIRAFYDFNKKFPLVSSGPSSGPGASLAQLFIFTGTSPRSMRPFAVGLAASLGLVDIPKTLPQNWRIEWHRFLDKSVYTTTSLGLIEARSGRKIDPVLSLGLGGLPNERAPAGLEQFEQVIKNLAIRNLRRGYALNVPSGQDFTDFVARTGFYDVEALDADKLTEGHTGSGLRSGGFTYKTPLWFYILKEAEHQNNGRRLGQIGSIIVAETLLGALFADEASFLNTGWTPADGPKPGGKPISNVRAMLSAAGVM